MTVACCAGPARRRSRTRQIVPQASSVSGMRRISKWKIATLFMLFGALLLMGTAALAAVEGGCSGTVTIGGATYTEANDSPSNPIVIPDEEGLIASWTGSTGSVIKDFKGELGVVIGPSSIVFADWEGPNDDEETDSKGDYAVDDAKDQIPVSLVGLYEVGGFHRGEGGDCEGSVMILLEGNPLTTPVGAGSAAGAVLALVGVLSAGRVQA